MTDAIAQTVDAILTEVNAISLPGPGYTRPSYSPEGSAAHRVIERRALAMGLSVSGDVGLNLFARLPGRNRATPPLYMGSHLDTVAMGGAYDGAAGAYVDSGTASPVDLVVTVTRAKESVLFPVSYIGSRAALRSLKPEEFDACRTDTGRTLADHMRAEGGDPVAVQCGPGLPAARIVEIHIEQGPVRLDADEPFALVQGVRGGPRYRQAQIHGTWAHSGGAPRAGRADAASVEHAFAKVPGELGFCVDIRSDDVTVLDRIDAATQAEIARIETRRGVRFDLGGRSRSLPSVLSGDLAAEIAQGAARCGLAPRRMLSGGGHDAAAFAQAGWQSVMVFLRNWDGSHNPAEGMDPTDLITAVRALKAAWDNGQQVPG